MSLKALFCKNYFSTLLLMTFFYFFEGASLQITDSTMYSSDKNINDTMTSRNHSFAILSNSFYKNFMLLNPDKCSFITFGIKGELQTDLVTNNIIKNSKLNYRLMTNLISPRILLALPKRRM